MRDRTPFSQHHSAVPETLDQVLPGVAQGDSQA